MTKELRQRCPIHSFHLNNFPHVFVKQQSFVKMCLPNYGGWWTYNTQKC